MAEEKNGGVIEGRRCMPKVFNVTGLCVPEQNYMVDLTDRVHLIVSEYICKNKYFTINRARQYGKTDRNA